LQKGKERYEITCAVCHGAAGDGDSLVARKMSAVPPPSLHEERFRALSPDDIYRIVTEGYGVMPRYSTILSPDERWAVVAYVKALQLSRNVPIDQLSPEQLKNVQSPPTPPKAEGAEHHGGEHHQEHQEEK
jgi:mono/diheme cytochrome c family protein